jgi:hypothetical protein
MEMSLLSHALLRISDAYEEHGDVLFVVCPLRNCECKAPKIGMNCNQSLTILFPFDSSRFSGQISRIYKGIPQKRHLHVPCKKRYLYTPMKVSFINNPEVKRRGLLLRRESEMDHTSLSYPAGSGFSLQDIHCIVVAVDLYPITSPDLLCRLPGADNGWDSIFSSYQHCMG